MVNKKAFKHNEATKETVFTKSDQVNDVDEIIFNIFINMKTYSIFVVLRVA